MKLAALAATVVLFVSAAYGQQPMELEFVGEPANHELSWNTTSNYHYHVDCSPDLTTWAFTGLSVPGTGSRVTYGFMSDADKLFYRVRVTADANDGGFLVKPEQDDTINEIDGVCFAFDLSGLSSLPDKIRIFERDYVDTSPDNNGNPWNLIGSITEFANRQIPAEQIDVDFVRGSVVWLPKLDVAELERDFEVQAVLVDSTGAVAATAIRRITIDRKEAPTIAISSGPASQTPAPIDITSAFELTLGDTVRRVEFYDNGTLIATAVQEPFVENLRDYQDNEVVLLRGQHSIVARAYDSTGAYSETAPYLVEATGGNARPEIDVTSPQNGLVVVEGDSFDIEYTVSDPDGSSDIYGVVASRYITPYSQGEEVEDDDVSAPFTDLTIDTTGWDPGAYTIKVVALDSTADVPYYPYTADGKSYPHYFTIYVKSATSATFAADLIEHIVDEATATPSNESFVGRESSSDEFLNAIVSGLQIDSGVLLTTGDFTLWDAGDLGDGKGEILDARGDFDLENRVAGRLTEDAAALEFDVFCPNGQLQFDYQFASEEYDEYVGGFVDESDVYNDAFMVTVDGAVVTWVPDCSAIVAVNSINNGSEDGEHPPVNRHLFFDDEIQTDLPSMVTPPNPQVEYDGVTMRLRAHVLVKPGTTHRVRIVIADVNDGQYDSGLFLEEGGLSTVQPQP